MIGSLNLGYQLVYLSLTLYGKQSRAAEKSGFWQAVYQRNNRKKKNEKMHTSSDKKSHKLWFEIIQWYSEVSIQIFKEIISLIFPYVVLIFEQQQQQSLS